MRVDALDEDAGEQEPRDDDHPPEAEARHPVQRRRDDGKGDARIGRFAPAQAQALPQQPHDLRDVGIGVGVGRAAADDDQRRIGTGDPVAGGGERALDAVPGGADEFRVDAEFAGVVHRRPVMSGRPCVQHRRDVVLGVAGGEEHPRRRENAFDPRRRGARRARRL